MYQEVTLKANRVKCALLKPLLWVPIFNMFNICVVILRNHLDISKSEFTST